MPLDRTPSADLEGLQTTRGMTGGRGEFPALREQLGTAVSL